MSVPTPVIHPTCQSITLFSIGVLLHLGYHLYSFLLQYNKKKKKRVYVLLNFVFIFEIMADFYHLHVKSKLIILSFTGAPTGKQDTDCR